MLDRVGPRVGSHLSRDLGHKDSEARSSGTIIRHLRERIAIFDAADLVGGMATLVLVRQLPVFAFPLCGDLRRIG
jgi:hypothetical protein